METEGCSFVFIPHAQRERGKVIDRGAVMSLVEKNLNRTLEIDSPFQTLTVGLLVEFIGERAKRARHSQVCSIENRGYI